MTALLNFPPFQLTTETWASYINRFKCVMDAANLSDIPPNRKKAYFLIFCEATVFDTATALLAPQMVKAVTWEELQEVLGNHYALKPSCIGRRSQVEGESIGEYMAALRSAALHCGFRDHLDEMLLDQLVCGDTRTPDYRAGKAMEHDINILINGRDKHKQLGDEASDETRIKTS
ncbi:hypothetical protein E2320_008983 [Naja naja]|nr:hypothetical protein E2320_008983 [Naja naja]